MFYIKDFVDTDHTAMNVQVSSQTNEFEKSVLYTTNTFKHSFPKGIYRLVE